MEPKTLTTFNWWPQPDLPPGGPVLPVPSARDSSQVLVRLSVLVGWNAPALLVDDLFQFQPCCPTAPLEFRLFEEFTWIPDTEVGNRNHSRRDAEDGPQVLVVEDAHPSDANALDPGRQPEVLDGTTRAVQVRVDHGVAPEHVGPGAGAVAGDAEIDGSLLDPLELERAIQVCPVAGVVGGRSLILYCRQRFDSGLGGAITNHDEFPQ